MVIKITWKSTFLGLPVLRGFHKSVPEPVRWVKLYDSNSSFYSPYGPRHWFVKAPLRDVGLADADFLVTPLFNSIQKSPVNVIHFVIVSKAIHFHIFFHWQRALGKKVFNVTLKNPNMYLYIFR